MKNNIGEYIKSKRLTYNNQGISQLDLSLKIGWENPSTLSRIEQGDTIPNKDTVIRILKALDINESLIIFILMKNLYLYDTPINNNYINKVIKNIGKRLEYSEYPIFVSFFTNNITEKNLYINDILFKIFIGGNSTDNSMQKFLFKKDVFELLFNPEYEFYNRVINGDEFRKIIVNNMYIIFNGEKDEEGYINSLMKFKDMKKFWNEKVLSSKNLQFFNIPFIYDSPLVGKISFFVDKIPFIDDNRFFIQKFIPQGKEDFLKLEKIKNIH